jgi:amidophosphoribosyltransferase
MCAIFGLGFMHGHQLRNGPLVQNFVRALFLQNMSRGRTSSGLAYVSVGGIKVIKKNVPAMGFLNLPEYDKTESECVNFEIDNPPLSILGHCRQKTKGTELNSKNNHPIICNKIVGVHNGMISNDDHLFRTYAKMFDRNGEVDSEIIFALIDYFSRKCPIHEAIQKMSAIVQGSLACAMVHEMQPHVIWLFRRFNPCDVVLFSNVGLLSWSSERNYIKSAIGGSLGEGEDIHLPQNSGMGIDLHRNKIHRFTIEESQNFVMY